MTMQQYYPGQLFYFYDANNGKKIDCIFKSWHNGKLLFYVPYYDINIIGAKYWIGRSIFVDLGDMSQVKATQAAWSIRIQGRSYIDRFEDKPSTHKNSEAGAGVMEVQEVDMIPSDSPLHKNKDKIVKRQ